MSSKPPGEPTGGNGIFFIAVMLVIVAALLFWAWSAHPPGKSTPAATGVPPTAPAKAVPTPH